VSALGDATILEALLPKAMAVLFPPREEDPLRHHSIGQIRLMRALLGGSRSAGDLSASLGLSPSSLTQMAARMIHAGLVCKDSDDHDRRVRKLSLTSSGKLLMEHRRGIRAQMAAEALDHLEPEKRALLIELMIEIASISPARERILAEVTV
jgi:DNA-binding MarR family transcriptional regulator